MGARRAETVHRLLWLVANSPSALAEWRCEQRYPPFSDFTPYSDAAPMGCVAPAQPFAISRSCLEMPSPT